MKMNIMSYTENSYVWHLLILICFQCIRNGQLGFLQTFYFNDLLMNSSENSMDNCMHSQTSAMVKFICNIYSVSLDISKKYFKMY